MNSTTKFITKCGIFAGLYVVLSLAVFPLASGVIQIRISEGLTLLPLIFPEAIVGLFVGCFLTNLITGCVILDCIFGSLITLIAGILTYFIGKFIKNLPLKIFVGGLFPVLLNAFLLPVIWYFAYGTGEFIYIVQVAFLTIGQALSVYAFGYPLLIATKKINNKWFN
ncbi:MAG: QueT transporter family protein [Clostridia bacterium]|nr:QueT transporter family protein [Clostridia bacterium]